MGRVVGKRVRRSCGHSLKRRNCAVDLRDLCRRLENVGRVAADGGEKRGVCGYVSRGRSSGSRNREVYGILFFLSQNKMSTVAGKLVAVQYFHRRAGIELPMRNMYLLQLKSGLARESAIHGEATRTRRPVSWVLLKHGIGLASEWGEGGRVLWLTLAVSYFFMCRASELYATSNGTCLLYTSPSPRD